MTNPAGDLDGIVKYRKVVPRPSLPKNELPLFLHCLEGYSSGERVLTQLSVKLLVLLFAQ